jgi:HEAT repeat protein
VENQPLEAVERWIQALADPHRDARSRAAYELGKLGDPRAVPPLILALSDEAKLVRSWAAGALGQIGAPAVEALLTALATPDGEVRYYAAMALGDMGDMRAVPMLVQAIQKGDWDIRDNAARTLDTMGATTTLPHRILAEPRLTTLQRLEALNALHQVAYHDEQIQLSDLLPDVSLFCQQQLQDQDEAVREGARAVLEILQNAAPLQTPLTHATLPEAEQKEVVVSEAQEEEAPTRPQTVEPDTSLPPDSKTKRSLWSRLLERDKGKTP